MLKKTLLSLLVGCSLVPAAKAAIDTEKFIFSYKKNFNDIISSHLFSSPSELRAADELRTAILHYANGTGLSVEEEAKLWEYYINNKFKSPENFKLALENTYLDEESIRKRFRENIIFSEYFEKEVEPKLRTELEERKRILGLAYKHDINVESEIVKHHFFNIVESFGGKTEFIKYLDANQLSLKDIYFFIKTDLLEPKVKQALVEKKLLSDEEFSENFLVDVSNFYHNRKTTNFLVPAKYHFTQFYLSKSITDKDGKSFKNDALKAYMDKVANELYLETPINEINDKYPELETMMMLEPISKDSQIYRKEFKDAIVGEGLGYISEVIESDKGFHILLIDEIIPEEQISFKQVQKKIEKHIKESYQLKDLETSIQI